MGLFSKLFKKKDKKAAEAKPIAANNVKAEEPVKSEVKAEAVKPISVTEKASEALTVKEKANVKPEVKPEAKPEVKTAAKPKATAPKAAETKAPTPKKAQDTSKQTEKPIQKKDNVKEIKAPAKEESNEEIIEDVSSGDEKKSYTGKFEVNRSKDGKKFFFNLFASNKVGIATSQMYSSAQSALTGVKSVIVNAPKAPIEDQTLKTFETLPNPKWEIYLDNGNKYRFRLNATNGSCVCHSQGYTTKTACKNGIDSIIRSSKNAEIVKTYIVKKDEE